MTKTNIDLPRRALVAGAAAAAGMAALAAPARAARIAGAADRRRGGSLLATGGIDDWRAARGTVFAAQTEAGTVALRLADVEPLAGGGARPGTLARDHSFAVHFEAAIGPLPAGNRTYRLAGGAHPALDVHFGSAGERLTAIFN